MGLLQAKAKFRPSKPCIQISTGGHNQPGLSAGSGRGRASTPISAAILLWSLLVPNLVAPPAHCAEGASLSGSVSLFRHGGEGGSGSGEGYIDEETGKFVPHEP